MAVSWKLDLLCLSLIIKRHLTVGQPEASQVLRFRRVREKVTTQRCHVNGEHHWLQGHAIWAAQPWWCFCWALPPHPPPACHSRSSSSGAFFQTHSTVFSCSWWWFFNLLRVHQTPRKKPNKTKNKTLDTMVRYPLWEVFAETPSSPWFTHF